MWINKKNAAFILIQVRGKGKLKFTFPISLYSFVELVESYRDLLKTINCLFPSNYRKITTKVSTEPIALTLSNIVNLLYQLFKEFRQLKGLTLVEVDLDELYIKVALS